MKKLSSAADDAIKSAQELVESNKSFSRELSLPPREKPLTVPDFGKLEHLINKQGGITSIKKSGTRPKLDYDGNIYGWEFCLEDVSIELCLDDDTDPRLIEAIKRPATSEGAVYHFTRLAGTKRNTRGKTGFQVILEDLAYDLRGKSEWAIMKACEYFRKQQSPFFPDHHEIIEKVEHFDKAAKSIKLKGQDVKEIENK